MSQEEFEKYKFTYGMKVEYKEKLYEIVALDFAENLIAIEKNEHCQPTWIRCENCTIVK